MNIKINLNDVVRFKLTDHGKDIYFHQYDELNEFLKEKGAEPIGSRYPKEDEEGYSKMQLWQFIELYGNHMGMAKPNVIEPLDLLFECEVQNE